jgi:RNA polymerase sigma-70 factor (ECF subfamily)
MAINRATRRAAPACVETGVLESASGQRDEPLEELIARERAHRLWEALERLKVIDREVLLAFYIQGRSLIEIAERFEAPIGTIKRRLHTARKRLRAELEASAGDPDEWSEAPIRDEDDDELDLVAFGAEASTMW